MAMQFYASPEQIMRDRSELARKGIARGRSAVMLSYEGGVLFVAENLSSALHKVSEIYDRIAFAAVGRYNEFENLRRAGVRMADTTGLSFDRRDVTGRALANAYAQTLGAIFTEQSKPFEVEICVAEVGGTPEDDELYRITYDGSVNDEPGRMAMGGQAEAVTGALKADHQLDMSLEAAVRLAVRALGSVGGEGGAPRTIAASQLEVAILDRRRVGRTFRRITGAPLTALLNGSPAEATGTETPDPKLPATGPDKPTESAASADLEGPDKSTGSTTGGKDAGNGNDKPGQGKAKPAK
ncbi:proteasome subunit alpha [Plantactinospora sp. S1510]|uniref:Proteasome subunit alpha n=1 Tax=Plantactinospora alkalitolerans TaxID=2789879 RepID=A0ABS0GZG8_9ACTN|nr:proteasome subunit alpha [Plantactinospora alkalitolerans]MBF9131615.1 proteasome subunit alpha [Plantactinospora alkalitolerans]